jgi:hypothetical protein
MVSRLRIFNLQRSTPNAQRSIQTVGRWTFGVGHWALPSCSVLLCSVLLAASITPNEKSAAARVAEIEARLGGRIGVAALDTSTNKRIDYWAEEQFPMCSTFKFLAAAAVLKRVNEKRRDWNGACLTTPCSGAVRAPKFVCRYFTAVIDPSYRNTEFDA